MQIAKQFISEEAQILLKENDFARAAFDEIVDSICCNANAPSGQFIINCSKKDSNGVVPIKNGIYLQLEERYEWYREKPLQCFRNVSGGPIDAYKEFGNLDTPFNVGLEFETGNVSSAHRAMNKLCRGIRYGELQMGFIILPIRKLYDYLTQRISNYEEIEPYFDLYEEYPLVVLGFDADVYDPNAPLIPKGNDGMSKRSVRKWNNQ